MINTLTRFYDVTAGRVTVDGHDVRAVIRASLRRQLGLVLQDSYLFSGTVGENIRYGRLDATDAGVVAAQAVNVHEFVEKLPEAYHTPLSERGGGLSQGQRQLLSFARGADRSADLDPERGDVEHRHAHGGVDPGRPADAATRADLAGDRPPAINDPRCRPGASAGARPHRRAGNT